MPGADLGLYVLLWTVVTWVTRQAHTIAENLSLIAPLPFALNGCFRLNVATRINAFRGISGLQSVILATRPGHDQRH